MEEYRIIRFKDAQTSYWAGGATTQLFIYPDSSLYKKLDFGYRISVATCELPLSDFSRLPGVERHLLMLQGSSIIRHEGQEAIVLRPYDGVDTFDGGIATTAEGKVTDFNLMTANGWQGKLEILASSSLLTPNPDLHSMALYCHEGQAILAWSNTELQLTAGELLVLKAPVSNIKVDLNGCKLICCSLWAPNYM